MLEDLGGIIQFHRKKCGLTQAELARLAGIGKAAVFDIEHTAKSPRIDTLIKVLNVLNIEIRLESPLMKSYRDQQHEKS